MNMNSDYNIGFCKPFGPNILECQCPDEIISGINSYVDDMSEEKKSLCSSKYNTDENFPNLLDRDFEVVYFTPKEAFDTGLSFFLLQTAKSYSRQIGMFDKQVILPKTTFSDGLLDVWVNRYYKNDITPPHTHRGNISGIIILDLPEDYDEQYALEFIWHGEIYQPEQKVGKTFLFPSELLHWVHKQKNIRERRTLSFNLFLH